MAATLTSSPTDKSPKMYSTKEFVFYKAFLERIMDSDLPLLRRIRHNATRFLCNFQYWQGKQQDPEGWIYKSMYQIEKETGLTKSQLETLRARLRLYDIIQERTEQGRRSYLVNWGHKLFAGLDVLAGKPQFTRKRDRKPSNFIKEKYREFAEQIATALPANSYQPDKDYKIAVCFVSNQLDIEDSEGNMNMVINQFHYLLRLRSELHSFEKVNVYTFFRKLHERDFQAIYKERKAEGQRPFAPFSGNQDMAQNTAYSGQDRFQQRSLKMQEIGDVIQKINRGVLKSTTSAQEDNLLMNMLLEKLSPVQKEAFDKKWADGDFQSFRHAINHINAKYLSKKMKP